MREYKEGDLVRAIDYITEGGKTYKPKAKAKFPEPNYVHAKPGATGKIIYVDKDGQPTVRFKKTGTATIVSLKEIELL